MIMRQVVAVERKAGFSIEPVTPFDNYFQLDLYSIAGSYRSIGTIQHTRVAKIK